MLDFSIGSVMLCKFLYNCRVLDIAWVLIFAQVNTHSFILKFKFFNLIDPTHRFDFELFIQFVSHIADIVLIDVVLVPVYIFPQHHILSLDGKIQSTAVIFLPELDILPLSPPAPLLLALIPGHGIIEIIIGKGKHSHKYRILVELNGEVPQVTIDGQDGLDAVIDQLAAQGQVGLTVHYSAF